MLCVMCLMNFSPSATHTQHSTLDFILRSQKREKHCRKSYFTFVCGCCGNGKHSVSSQWGHDKNKDGHGHDAHTHWENFLATRVRWNFHLEMGFDNNNNKENVFLTIKKAFPRIIKISTKTSLKDLWKLIKDLDVVAFQLPFCFHGSAINHFQRFNYRNFFLHLRKFPIISRWKT